MYVHKNFSFDSLRIKIYIVFGPPTTGPVRHECSDRNSIFSPCSTSNSVGCICSQQFGQYILSSSFVWRALSQRLLESGRTDMCSSQFPMLLYIVTALDRLRMEDKSLLTYAFQILHPLHTAEDQRLPRD